jgi:ABC-type antimicrobial peptide transport system permease subunit
MGVFVDDELQEGNGREVTANRLTPGWFAAVRVPLLSGRDFSWQDRQGSPQVAIVNRTLADRFWNGSALGKRVRFTGRRNVAHDVQIVGIVADSKYWTLGETIQPALYLPVHQADIGDDLTLHVRTASFAATTDTIARELQRIVPEGVVETRSMTDAIAVAVMPARVGAAATGAFGALAMLLSAMGIYGLVSFAVLQRTQEIGIRKAIGAGTSQIVRLVIGGSLILVGTGLIAGLAIGVLGAQALGGLIVGVSAGDPVTLAAVTFLVLLAALVSSALPAIRAARMDPLLALRKDA